MEYGLRDLGALLRTPAGRLKVLREAHHKCWPILSRAAAAHRRTLARRCRVIAVIGTYGKTTTAQTVRAALGTRLGTDLTGNCWNYLAGALLRVGPRGRRAVFEVGIGDFGQMAQYAWMLRPDLAVVTCVGTEHHRSLRSLEITREEKARMVRALPPSGVAVLNADDPHVMQMAARTQARVVTYGFGAGSDVRATEVRPDWPSGTRFRLHAGGREREACVRPFGRHMVYPALAAVAVALAEGLALVEVLPRIESMPAAPGRMQVVALPNGAYVLRDDFKSSYETIESAFDAFALVPAERRIVVLGDVSEPPGSQGPIYRHFGRRIAETASRAIIVGTQLQRYGAGAARAGMPRGRIIKAGASLLRAAEGLRRELRAGDVVLVKGRDVQRLERLVMILQGRRVRCDIRVCRLKSPCASCPMLEDGWGQLRPVT